MHLIEAAQAIQAVGPLEAEVGGNGRVRLEEHKRLAKLLLFDEGDGLGGQRVGVVWGELEDCAR